MAIRLLEYVGIGIDARVELKGIFCSQELSNQTDPKVNRDLPSQ
jgi:hypothetical protein